MDAIEKNTALQLMQEVSLSDTKTPIGLKDLTEALQRSQFATILVIVPESLARGEGVDLTQGESESAGDPPAKLNVLEVFRKTAIPAKTNYGEHDFEFGDVKVNFSTMEASRLGDPLKLTSLEFKTLKYLIQNARRVISRDELLNEVWGYEHYPTTRTVDNQVLKLRKKLERDTSRPIHFQTVHGTGYKFLP